MSDPRYRPRDFCDQPEFYGKFEPLSWRSAPSAEERARLIAAQLQHRYSMRIQARLRERRETLKSYAARPETPSYDRLTKVLRGEAIMRFEDVGLAHLLLGEILPAPSASSAANPRTD